jgi:hypothetical protein
LRRLAAALAAALTLGALSAAVALAVSVQDRDDVTTALDISKVSGAHNRATDRLVQTIDFYGPVKPGAMVNKGKPPSTVCVEIWTRSTPAESPADYEACAGPAAKGKGWVGSIARKRDVGPLLRVGTVKVEQPTATRLVLRIDPDAIKRPASYRWRTEATSFGSDCKSSTGCPDYAPDRPDTAETKLSKPRP